MQIKKHKANDIINDTITNGHGNTEFCLWSDVEPIVDELKGHKVLVDYIVKHLKSDSDRNMSLKIYNIALALTPRKEAKE